VASARFSTLCVIVPVYLQSVVFSVFSVFSLLW